MKEREILNKHLPELTLEQQYRGMAAICEILSLQILGKLSPPMETKGDNVRKPNGCAPEGLWPVTVVKSNEYENHITPDNPEPVQMFTPELEAFLREKGVYDQAVNLWEGSKWYTPADKITKIGQWDDFYFWSQLAAEFDELH